MFADCWVAIICGFACRWLKGVDTAMALLEKEFTTAIEAFASDWQNTLNNVDKHDNGNWDDVKVLERVCFLG
jgi:hypothetical protein